MPDQSPERLAALEAKIDAIYDSVEKTRRYFLWTLIVTLVVLVLPLLGMAALLPKLLNTYQSMLTGI